MSELRIPISMKDGHTDTYTYIQTDMGVLKSCFATKKQNVAELCQAQFKLRLNKLPSQEVSLYATQPAN